MPQFSALGTGAGAAHGLEVLLARQREDELAQQRAQAQAAQQQQQQATLAEQMRSNRVDEGLRGRALDVNQESAGATRDATQAYRTTQINNQLRDDVRAREDRRVLGSNVEPGEYEQVAQMGVLPMSAYDKTTEMQGDDASEPVSVIKFRGTEAQLQRQGDDARREREFEATQGLRKETAATNELLRRRGQDITVNLGNERNATAGQREQRMSDWGPPLATINDPNSSSGATVLPRNQIPATGAAAPAPPSLRTQSISNEVSTEQLDRLIEMYDPALVGPFVGNARSIGQHIPGVPVNDKFAELSAATAAFRNSVIKAITGAQMGEKEATRIRQQIPDVNDKPAVWEAKARQTRKNLQDLNAMLARRGGTAPTSTKIGRFDMTVEP